MATLIIKALAAVVTAAVNGLFSRPSGVPYLVHVAAAGIRALSLNKGFTEGTITPTTAAGYQSYTRSKGVESRIVTLSEGGKGLWFGSEKAEKVILFLHGGAYMYAASSAHYELADHWVSAAKEQGHDSAVFFLSYDLGEISRYPKQLKQATVALQYLLSSGRTPYDIILSGDSSGANLALSLLSHLTHPHVDVKHIDLEGRKLRGLFLMSPWISFTYNTTSAKENEDKDLVTAAGLTRASNLFLKGTGADEYNEPLRAPETWWQGIPVKDILITCGTYEIFADDTKAFHEKLRKHNPSAELFMAQHEIHGQYLMNIALRYQMADSERRVQEWILKLV